MYEQIQKAWSFCWDVGKPGRRQNIEKTRCSFHRAQCTRMILLFYIASLWVCLTYILGSRFLVHYAWWLLTMTAI